jgi:para-nitrobenzyl esterase
VSGRGRFKAAAPLQPWTGVKDALRLGNTAIQGPRVYLGVNEPPPAEDCLYLNVWTPAIDGKKHPVMFYNHGGGFVLGSGGTWYQDGGNLARNHDGTDANRDKTAYNMSEMCAKSLVRSSSTNRQWQVGI